MGRVSEVVLPGGSQPGFARHVAANLKRGDVLELNEYGLGYLPLIDLQVWAKRKGTRFWTIDDEPVAIGGIDDGKHPWLFTTDRVREVKKSCHKIAKQIIRDGLEKEPELWNYVSRANVDSLVWLYALGAKFDEEKMYSFSQSGGVFVKFFWRREDV